MTLRVATCIGLLWCLLAFAAFEFDLSYIVLLGVTGLCAVIVLSLLGVRKDELFGQPVAWLAVAYFLYFAVNAFAADDAVLATEASLVAALSFLALAAAYLQITRRLPTARISFRYPAFELWLAVALYMTGAIATIIAIAKGVYLGQFAPEDVAFAPYLSILLNFRLIGCGAVMALGCYCGWRRTWWAAALVIFGELASASLTTSKQDVAYPALIFVLAYVLVNHRFPWKPLAIIVPVVALLGSITYILRISFQDVFSSSNITFDDLSAYFSSVTGGSVVDQNAITFKEAFDAFVERFHGITSLSAILGNVPPSDYQSYSGWRYAYDVMMPRFLYPDKPDLDYQIYFAHSFFGHNSLIRIQIPPTQIGVWLLDYGIVGVVVGSAVYGLMSGYIYRFFFRTPRHSLWFGLYCWLVIQLVKIETHPIEWLSGTLKNVVPVSLLIWVLWKALRLLVERGHLGDSRRPAAGVTA